MRDRLQPILRLVCLALAAVLVYQVTQSAFRGNPVSHLSIPQLPTLASDTNSPPAKPTDGRETNSIAKGETNKPATNVVVAASSAKGTNAAVADDPGIKGTNSTAKPTDGTNSMAAHVAENKGTNSAAGRDAKIAGTNAPAQSNTVMTAVNAGPRPHPAGRRAGGPGGMPPGMGMPGGGGPPLPAPIHARVDRIVDSEILGMVMHPVPMGLLGIAGNSAFLRAPNGQTGLVKEGDELGGIKLIRIGINRVLVEEAGESKELTVFSGLGGQSLLPTQKGNSNEPNH